VGTVGFTAIRSFTREKITMPEPVKDFLISVLFTAAAVLCSGFMLLLKY
jgi:hypothetical protein